MTLKSKILLIVFLTLGSQAGFANDVLIPVKQIRQETNLCVPTSAAMVLNFYGTPHSPREIKMWADGKEFDPSAPFNSFTITWFKDLLAGLERHGILWRNKTYSNDDNGFKVGLTDIKSQIELGLPVLVDTSLFTGHTFVIAGYKNDGETWVAIDPNINPPGIRKIPVKDLAQIWNSTVVGSNLRGAIFTR